MAPGPLRVSSSGPLDLTVEYIKPDCDRMYHRTKNMRRAMKIHEFFILISQEFHFSLSLCLKEHEYKNNEGQRPELCNFTV